jgi:hyperosmotically inducible periplasmic protein
MSFNNARYGISFAATLMLTLCAFSSPSRAQGFAARAGEALDNAGRNVRNTVENAVAQSKAAAYEQDLLSRVYGRIHWDKYLAASTLEIQTQADGTVVLRGATTDKVRKERAVALALDTVGITRVIDEISVSPAVINAPPVPPTPASSTTISIKPAQAISAPPLTAVEAPPTTAVPVSKP